MDKYELESRTLAFAANVIRYVDALPRQRSSDVVARQLLRSATSIGANYREANRAESRKDFIHKIGVVEKEASETEYWFQLLVQIELADGADALTQESRELLRIFTAIGRTTRRNAAANTIRDGEEEVGFRISDFEFEE